MASLPSLPALPLLLLLLLSVSSASPVHQQSFYRVESHDTCEHVISTQYRGRPLLFAVYNGAVCSKSVLRQGLLLCVPSSSWPEADLAAEEQLATGRLLTGNFLINVCAYASKAHTLKEIPRLGLS